MSQHFTQPENIRHISTDNTLPMVEHTPQRQNSDSSNPINKLAEAIASIASQQWLQTSSAILKPTTTNILIVDGKNFKFELFEGLFQTLLKMQPEMSKAMKINHFHSFLPKDALQIFRNINASSKRTLEDVLIVFRRIYVRPQSQAAAKHKWHKLTFEPHTKPHSDFLEELNECAERASHLLNSNW